MAFPGTRDTPARNDNVAGRTSMPDDLRAVSHGMCAGRKPHISHYIKRWLSRLKHWP
jgi:hypothetical protein